MGGAGVARLGLAVFGLALVVRLCFLAVTPPPQAADSRDYDGLAQRLLGGQGYVTVHGDPTSRRPPGYALFLAGIYALLGPGTTGVGVVQAVLDATTCLLVYLLGRRIFGERVGVAAGGLCALSLGLVAAARMVLAESLLAFLVVVSAWLLHTGLARPSALALAGAGVALGLGTLTKGSVVLLPVLVGWVVWRSSGGARRVAVRNWAIVLVGFGLTLLPWVVRNYVVHGRFVLVATQMGQVIYSSHNPPQGKIFGVYTRNETSRRIRSTLPEADQSRAFLAETARHLREHPETLPRVMILKVVYFVSPIDWETIPGSGVVNFSFLFGAPFALAGLWRARGYGWPSDLLITMLAGFLLMALLTYGSPRLRLPAWRRRPSRPFRPTR